MSGSGNVVFLLVVTTFSITLDTELLTDTVLFRWMDRTTDAVTERVNSGMGCGVVPAEACDHEEGRLWNAIWKASSGVGNQSAGHVWAGRQVRQTGVRDAAVGQGLWPDIILN